MVVLKIKLSEHQASSLSIACFPLSLKPHLPQLTVDRGQFLENLFHILRFESDRNVDKLRQRVDKDKWSTEPAVVNAFYNPNKNDIGKEY